VANTKQAAKRAKQAEQRRQHNVALRSRMRTTIKKVTKALDSGSVAEAVAAFKDSAASLDSMVNKGLTHRNKAARHKSRLNKAIKNLANAAPGTAAVSAKTATKKKTAAKKKVTKKKVAKKS
jgi:small subunit ribosomal protein S20